VNTKRLTSAFLLVLFSTVSVKAMAPSNTIFIYGTLLDHDILRLVLGRKLPADQRIAAALSGYAKYTYPGDSFPILQTQLDAQATGAVLLELTVEDLDRMHFYEGDEYGFAEITVTLDDGRVCQAHYNKASDEEIVSHQAWSLDFWQSTEKAIFLDYTERYMALYGNMSIDEADVFWRDMVDTPNLQKAGTA
jgi:gamma-glutamylcyclotransferase (GGCT)/AIG2-like uncharacterized protein YtfP